MIRPELTPPASSASTAQVATLPMMEGLAIALGGVAEAVAAITGSARQRTSFTLLPLTFPALAAMRRDPRVRAAYRAASCVTAGATPLAWLAGGRRTCVGRVSGRDLVTPLAEAAVEHGLTVFLIGSDDAQLARAGQRLVRETSGGIDIAGSWALAPGDVISDAEVDRMLARIGARGAQLCLIALDTPRQELFALRAATRGTGIAFVCLGDAFDRHS